MPSEGKTPFRRHCRVCVPRRVTVFKPYAGTRAQPSRSPRLCPKAGLKH
ncbi:MULTISPECIES: hypothetical protein [Neisseria]|nr:MULTISPECIES: hypothetical protein [Neisseria]